MIRLRKQLIHEAESVERAAEERLREAGERDEEISDVTSVLWEIRRSNRFIPLWQAVLGEQR